MIVNPTDEVSASSAMNPTAHLWERLRLSIALARISALSSSKRGQVSKKVKVIMRLQRVVL